MIVRHAANDKKYLYDMINIKKKQEREYGIMRINKKGTSRGLVSSSKTRVSSVAFLSVAILMSGVGTGVVPMTGGEIAKAKQTPVSLAKKKVTLTVTQSGKKKICQSTGLKVVKKKGVTIKKIKWQSYDPSVAKVNKKGKVTAVEMGACRIYVKVRYRYKNKTTTDELICNVKVKNRYKNVLTDIKFKHDNYATFVGNSEGVCPCFKSVTDLGDRFYLWDCIEMKVADTTVAAPGKDGYILGLKPGTTTVTISSTDGSGLSVTATVRVYPSAVDMPPEEDLYESQKDVFMERLEEGWTEEEKKRFTDKNGNVKWDYSSEAQFLYDENCAKINDDYENGRITDHPDGSAEDAVLSLISTRDDMLTRSDGDEVFFNTLKEKVVSPILNAKNLSELKEVCSGLGKNGIKALLNSDFFNQEIDNQDLYIAIIEGEQNATEEEIRCQIHSYLKVSSNCFSELNNLKGTSKQQKKTINTFVKNVLGYMGVTDKYMVSKTKGFMSTFAEAAAKDSDSKGKIIKLSTLDKKYPNIGIKEWTEKYDFSNEEDPEIYFDGKASMSALNNALASGKNLDALKGYAILTAVSDLIVYTRQGLRDMIMTFETHLIEGKKDSQIQKVVEKQFRNNLDGLLNRIPWDYDQVYTRTVYSKTYKSQFESMVKRYVDTYREAISESNYSKKARSGMLDKINKMRNMALYPTEDEYATLRVQDDMRTAGEGGNLAETLLHIESYEAYLVHLTTREEYGSVPWWAPENELHNNVIPWENNAFANSELNMTILCHVCCAPIFEDNPTCSEAIDVKNISYMATTIGHEIGHHFDSSGNIFNSNGNIQRCWEPSDEEAFEGKVEKIAGLYGPYAAFISDKDRAVLYQDGKSVSDEAIADLGGTEIALRLLKKTYPGNDDRIRDFFVMTAEQWNNTKFDYDHIADMEFYLEDIHPQSRARANGVAMCMDEFYRVFDVKEGDAMYLAPEDRVELWEEGQ